MPDHAVPAGAAPAAGVPGVGGAAPGAGGQWSDGGPIPHHGSHRSGRDVDVLFYLLDREGFIRWQGRGEATEYALSDLFETTRELE